jgi:hypothetical protein
MVLVGNKNVRRGGSWIGYFHDVDFACGYRDHWSGAPWPENCGQWYEKGRLFAAELHSLGDTGPTELPRIRGPQQGVEEEDQPLPRIL